jgi:uncharacterized protein (DUF885 family)
MKKFSVVLLFCTVVAIPRLQLHAQLRAMPAPTPADSLSQDIAARSRQLSRLFDEIWQDKLRHEPEYATALGDKRYDDQLTDYSPRATNDSLARGRAYIQHLSAIDTTGLPHQQQLSADLMLRQLIEDQEGPQFKEWEMPVNQFNGLHLDLPQLVPTPQLRPRATTTTTTSRASPKSPPPSASRSDNMLTGIDDQRVPPKYLLEKVLVQVNAIARAKARGQPLRTAAQKIPRIDLAADQQAHHDDLLAAITKQVYPAYQRFANFLQATYIPAGRADPGVWPCPTVTRTTPSA